VPAAPVRTIPEVVEDEHMHVRGMLQRVGHPVLGDLVLPSGPMRFHGSDQAHVEPSPALGEHAAEVLGDWLGLDEGRVAALAAEGVIAEGDAT
jgi:CoA:oxalate CoA-transferase